MKIIYIKWNIVFTMINTKIPAPNNSLFNQVYKLSYFSESLSKYEENQLKLGNSNLKCLKS